MPVEYSIKGHESTRTKKQLQKIDQKNPNALVDLLEAFHFYAKTGKISPPFVIKKIKGKNYFEIKEQGERIRLYFEKHKKEKILFVLGIDFIKNNKREY